MLSHAVAILAALQPPVASGTAIAPTAPPPATEVSGITVVAHRPHGLDGVTVRARLCPEPSPRRYPVYTDPRVIDSFPAEGAVLPAGPVTVRVTFDQPMSCYAEFTVIGAETDPCDDAGAWSLPARRTWTTRCRFVDGAHYVLHFARSDGPGFVGLSARPARPFTLRFRTAEASEPAATANMPVDPGPAAQGPTAVCTDGATASATGGCVRSRSPDTPPPPS